MTDALDRNSERTPLAKTLLLTIALPDFYAEDITQAEADELYEGDLTDLVYEAMSLITHTVRVTVATGSKSGNDFHSVRGVIQRAEVVDRENGHDQPEDERLTAAIEEGRTW